MIKFRQSLILLAILFFVTFSFGANASSKKLPIPRFATIKSNEVNARTGPAIKCPIEWVFIKKGEPIEIIAEYEHWRNIRDINGEGGWVHLSLLSTKRAVIIISKEAVPLTKSPTSNSKVVAIISTNVRCQLNKCKDNWCRVKYKHYEGWLPRKVLWGVYKDEKF